MLQPCELTTNGSILSTPKFAVTPEEMFTPFRDMFSPRDDNTSVYDARNRPTDYSSSIPYYKPDESDQVLDGLCKNDKIVSDAKVIPADLNIP